MWRNPLFRDVSVPMKYDLIIKLKGEITKSQLKKCKSFFLDLGYECDGIGYDSEKEIMEIFFEKHKENEANTLTQ